MELVIAKWKEPYNGSKYTMHFAESDDWFSMFSAVDELGSPYDCEMRLINDWHYGSTFFDCTTHKAYINHIKYLFYNVGSVVETTTNNNQTKEKYEQLAQTKAL